jgi:hypothetical protein
VFSEKESQTNFNNLVNVCINITSDNKVVRDTIEHKSGKMKKTVNSVSKKVKGHKRKVAKKVASVITKSAPKEPTPSTITKLPGRQTNNSLSSITAGHILIETTNTVPSSTNTSTVTPTASASKNVDTTPTSSPAASPRKKKNKAADV